MIRLAIVDDHPLYLNGLTRIFNAATDMTIVGIGTSAEEAITLARRVAPDVLVIDMDMAGGGAAAVRALASEAPTVRPLMITVEASEERACEVIERGARGYLLKSVSAIELAHAVRVIHSGKRYVTPTMAPALLTQLQRTSVDPDDPDNVATLSDRESQILSLIALGCSNREIGGYLGLSERTIKHYVSSLLQKLGVRNRVEAALIGTPGRRQ